MSTAGLPAELREAAGKAAHVLRCKQAGPDHAPKDCPVRAHNWGAFHCDLCGADITIDGPAGSRKAPCSFLCTACDPLLAAWPDLTEAQRESFRASQDPALSVVALLLADSAECVMDFPCSNKKRPNTVLCRCDCDSDLTPDQWCSFCRLRARLAALGVRP